MHQAVFALPTRTPFWALGETASLQQLLGWSHTSSQQFGPARLSLLPTGPGSFVLVCFALNGLSYHDIGVYITTWLLLDAKTLYGPQRTRPRIFEFMATPIRLRTPQPSFSELPVGSVSSAASQVAGATPRSCGTAQKGTF